MRFPLFQFPSFIYPIDDWSFKKKALLSRINKGEFIRTDLQNFETDRQTNGKTYVRYLEEFLKPQLMQFCEEAKVSCSISDAWCVKYQKGDHQTTHNHRGWGFSGLIHVEFFLVFASDEHEILSCSSCLVGIFIHITKL